MKITGLTWQGPPIDDAELLSELPRDLSRLLAESNGFVLHAGALHVRGATTSLEWHSLRSAWRGPHAIHTLYNSVQPTDVPFAQDQLGDQYLVRDGSVLRLNAETDEVEPLARNLREFFDRLDADIEGFLNVGLQHVLEPGQLLLAFPPFVIRESSAGTSLRSLPAAEVIEFHADLARQIREVPEGARVQFKIV